MRAAVIKQHGPPHSIILESRSPLEPNTDQVLVRIQACGLNHLDTWVRRGVPGHRFPLPLVPGSDITGVVEKVGTAVTTVKTGDAVIINPALTCGQCAFCISGHDDLCVQWGLLGETTDGGCQEFLTVKANQVF